MNLIIREDMTVDSVTVAEQCAIEHRAALQLLKTHRAKLESKFGGIAFEMRKGEKLPQGGFAKATRIAHALTEALSTPHRKFCLTSAARAGVPILQMPDGSLGLKKGMRK